MLTKGIVVVGVLCLVLPVGVFAQGFTQGDKVLLLNASGVSDNGFDSTIFSVAGDLGYFFFPRIEGDLRQSVQFSNLEGLGSSTNASTRGALDYHLDMGRMWPFIGASIGYIYGDNVTDSWEAGLEGGLKYFVNTTTFVLGRVEYQWFFNSSHQPNGFDNGQWVYVVGIGFRW
jgi:hypothetical protein